MLFAGSISGGRFVGICSLILCLCRQFLMKHCGFTDRRILWVADDRLCSLQAYTNQVVSFFLCRQLQMQTLAQLQEQDTFKALDPAQQQQVSMQMMQSNPLVLQHMQQLQQLQHMQQQTQQQQQQQQQISQGQGLTVPTAAPLQQQSQLPQ